MGGDEERLTKRKMYALLFTLPLISQFEVGPTFALGNHNIHTCIGVTHILFYFFSKNICRLNLRCPFFFASTVGFGPLTRVTLYLGDPKKALDTDFFFSYGPSFTVPYLADSYREKKKSRQCSRSSIMPRKMNKGVAPREWSRATPGDGPRGDPLPSPCRRHPTYFVCSQTERPKGVPWYHGMLYTRLSLGAIVGC